MPSPVCLYLSAFLLPSVYSSHYSSKLNLTTCRFPVSRQGGKRNKCSPLSELSSPTCWRSFPTFCLILLVYMGNNITFISVFSGTGAVTTWLRGARTRRASRRRRSRPGWTSTRRTPTRPRERRSCWPSSQKWRSRRWGDKNATAFLKKILCVIVRYVSRFCNSVSHC